MRKGHVNNSNHSRKYKSFVKTLNEFSDSALIKIYGHYTHVYSENVIPFEPGDFV